MTHCREDTYYFLLSRIKTLLNVKIILNVFVNNYKQLTMKTRIFLSNKMFILFVMLIYNMCFKTKLC